MKADLTDDEAKLLESLEAEGLFSPKIAARVRTALRIANAAGRKRTLIVSGLALFFLTTLLCSAGYFFSGVIGWASFLCWSNGLLSFGGAIACLGSVE
jgi:hypothetical protein